jgi:hypothetical protein
MVQGIAAVPTEEIDLTGRTGSFASKVKLVLPNTLVKLAGEATADFRATIQEAMASRTLSDVGLVPVDLSTRWALKTQPPNGSVQIQGTQLIVDGVRPEQVRLLLDCSVVKRAGTYVLHPHPEVASGVTVQDWSPREISVDFVASGK